MSTRRPSLFGRAVLAVILMVGFYGLAIAVAAGLLFIAYADVTYTRSVHPKLVLLCVIGAGVILWSILPRIDRFESPGPRLDQPRLASELKAIADSVGQPMPDEVFLVSNVNAWVGRRGGWMGIGSRRIMGLGLPLLRILTVNELRAVLGHEFGHYHGGETSLGPWLYKTRAALGRTIGGLAGTGSILRFPFLWYGKMFLLVTHAISRRQELAADELAARTIGARALAEGLKKVHGAAMAFPVFINTELVPVMEAGFRPPLAEGFGLFLNEAAIARAVDSSLEKELRSAAKDAYDTHPPLRERLEALESLPPGTIPEPDPPAVSLLDGLPELEAELLAGISEGDAAKLKPVTWADIGELVYVPRWEAHHREYGSALRGMTASALPDVARVEWGRSLSKKRTSDEQALALAGYTVGCALALALRNKGWVLDVQPGAAVVLRNGDAHLEPFEALSSLAEARTTPQAWRERCAALGISDWELA